MSLNPFMPNGLFYLYSSDSSIPYIRSVWLVFISIMFVLILPQQHMMYIIRSASTEYIQHTFLWKSIEISMNFLSEILAYQEVCLETYILHACNYVMSELFIIKMINDVTHKCSLQGFVRLRYMYVGGIVHKLVRWLNIFSYNPV